VDTEFRRNAKDTVKENNKIKIKLSPDGYQAHLYWENGEGLKTFHEDEARQALAEAGVVFGVKEDILPLLGDVAVDGEPILIAEGVKPIDGKDGWIEFLFDTQAGKPTGEASKKIDLHELHMIHNVLEGQKLAVIHPPEPGVPGMTVRGAKVMPKDGKKAVVRTGPNTALSAGEPSAVVATTDGAVVLQRDGTVAVLPTVTIRGDIDYSTGNIEFVGSLIVLGDIKSDFSVRVKKNIEVHGNVEDAHVEAGGNVTVKKGFIGHGKGTITAKGSVRVDHVLNQTIISEQDVEIQKESVGGTIRAGRKIIAPQATVVGGFLDADQEVEVKNLGSGEHAQARVRVGRRGRILERLAEIEKQIIRTERQAAEVKEAIYRLIRMKLDTGFISDEKQETLTKLQEAQKVLLQTLQTLQAEKELLPAELQKAHAAHVIVHDTVYENVLIDINGMKKLVENPLQDVIFVETGGLIELRSPREEPSQ